MPHALTPRQSEYLEFIREYIKENETSPQLKEIADHFGVKKSTAHNALEALMKGGYVIFGRPKGSSFFIRLIERAGTTEWVYEVPVVGTVDGFGLLNDFPKLVDHFPAVLPGTDPTNISALIVAQDIPEANINSQDILICDMGKRPQPGDIAILPLGRQAKKFFLARIHELTMDKNMPNPEVATDYPLPETMIEDELGRMLYWSPLAFSEETEEHFSSLLDNLKVPLGPISPDLIIGTVLKLIRNLAF